MSERTRIVLFVGFVAASTMLGGCGPHEISKKETYPTQGRILYKGEPVRFAAITLDPVDNTIGMPADGATDLEGNFNLRTYSNEGPDGAVPGEYKLTIGPGEAKPVGHSAKKDPAPTAVPPESRQVSVVIEAKDNDLGDITLP